MLFHRLVLYNFLFLSILASCKNKNSIPSQTLIDQIELKRGGLISCGPSEKQFGSIDFDLNGSDQTKKDFNLAVALLHSFEYDEAEKVFAKIIDTTPQCAMAYWGVSMCNFHPLWTPPTEPELQKGQRAIEVARSISQPSKRESEYINAIALFYQDWKKTDHHTRCVRFEKSMEQLHLNYPEDKEAAIFYALALDAAADPMDKTYARQKKAGALLNALYPLLPDHPGIIHYIIHTYDYPGLAQLALPAAKRYASVAPSSAHALHMPSHIFTRLGLWNECIESNLASIEAAKCYASSAGIKGHWDEELHSLDYLVYAYLQKGENKKAREQVDYLNAINEVYPVNFKVAYAFAAIPSRYLLENKKWEEAAALQIRPSLVPWDKFPWQEAIFHFTRLLGATHTGHPAMAMTELNKLNQLHDALVKQKDWYKSRQVEIQIKTGEAWIQLAAGKNAEALRLMKLAADMEDSTEKHPVTPGEVLPARELLADMFLQLGQYTNAVQSYEEVLQKSSNRFNSLYGAGRAEERSGNRKQARVYYKQLSLLSDTTNAQRSEVNVVKSSLMKQ